MAVNIRQAKTADVPQIQIVRNAVKENMLSNPLLVTDEDCETFINVRGRGWVAEINERIVGFSIIDLKENNVWALFVLPGFEKHGIGKQLHDCMLDWYFTQTGLSVWLGTEPGTRAESFYRKAGWSHIGNNGSKELKFEMGKAFWVNNKWSPRPSQNINSPRAGC